MSTKRLAVIEAATRLFADEGYHAVGVDRIAEHSGVAKMTMYKHFPSKEALVCEVLTTSMNESQQSLEEWVMHESGVMARLQAVFSWQARRLKNRDDGSTLFIGAISEYHSENNQVLEVAVEQKRKLRQFIGDLLLSLFEQETAARIARQLVMLLDGAILATRIGEAEAIDQDAWSAAQRLVAIELASTKLPRSSTEYTAGSAR